MPVWKGGAVHGISHVGRRWTADESSVHINVLELLAAKLTLLALAPSVWNTHIRLMLDNTTAAAYIDKMGGLHSPACNDIALAIWTWAKDRHNWLSTAYIPDIDNNVADFHSRNFRDNTEWMLNPVVFTKITLAYFVPKVDLFASRLNCQLHPFVSWKPELGAWAINAFSLDKSYLLCFPSIASWEDCWRKFNRTEQREYL